MSKILLLEPYKMMQQAIVLSLFPDHEVQLAETLPDSGVATMSNYDLIIIDAAEFREKDMLSTARAIESLDVPVIWLESEDRRDVASRDTLVILHRPIAREGLAAAVAQCLASRPANKANEKSNGPEKERKRSTKEPVGGKGQITAAPDTGETQIIELVDVVEEAPKPRKTKK
jgi:hypothetical protein